MFFSIGLTLALICMIGYRATYNPWQQVSATMMSNWNLAWGLGFLLGQAFFLYSLVILAIRHLP